MYVLRSSAQPILKDRCGVFILQDGHKKVVDIYISNLFITFYKLTHGQLYCPLFQNYSL